MEALETAGIIIGLTFGAFFSWIGLLYSYAVVRDWLKGRRKRLVMREAPLPGPTFRIDDVDVSIREALQSAMKE